LSEDRILSRKRGNPVRQICGRNQLGHGTSLPEAGYPKKEP
jgi:hypothetical protein